MPVNGFHDDLNDPVGDTDDVDRKPSRPNGKDVLSSMLVASLPRGCERQTAWRGREPSSGIDTPLKCGGPRKGVQGTEKSSPSPARVVLSGV